MSRIARYVPTGLDIRTDNAGDDVGLRFERGDDYVELVFPRSALQPLFDQILAQTRIGPTSAIESRHTSPESVVTPEGHEVFLDPSGDVVMNIRLRTDDGPRVL